MAAKRKSGRKKPAARGKKPVRKKPAARKPARKQAATTRETASAAGNAKPAAPRNPARPAGSAFQPATRQSYSGGCHCGALEFTFESSLAPARWKVNRCQCDFCRGHGARMTADPEGEVHFEFNQPEYLRRYRFGLRSTEFFICRACGTYVAAVLLTGVGARADININTLRAEPKGASAGKPVSYSGESLEDRRARRTSTWTPVVGPV